MSHVHGEGHRHGARARRRALLTALALTLGYTVVEIVAGVLTGSLALLADAGHMVSDNVSLGLALFAVWLGGKPATPQRSFGFKRAEVLAALANGAALVGMAIWILVEAGRRFADPPSVSGGWMLLVAGVGLAVNVAAALVLIGPRRGNLNVEAAFRHVLGDLAGSVGTLVAAGVIMASGWLYADPLASVFIALLILASSWSILRDSLRILLEAAPAGLDVAALRTRLLEEGGVVDVHDLHVWTITSGFPALAAHVVIAVDVADSECRSRLERVLSEDFGIVHTTLQLERLGDEPDCSLGTCGV